MINIKIIGDARLIRYLQGLPAEVGKEVAEAIKAQTESLLACAKRKASGEILENGLKLQNQTGNLRRAITARIEGSGINTVGFVGTNVPYAAAHEFGFQGTGTTTVRAHNRRTLKEMKKAKSFRTLRDGTRQAYIRMRGKRGVGTGSTQVSAHTRNWRVNLPERSFLRAALRELKPEIIAALDAAVQRGIKR